MSSDQTSHIKKASDYSEKLLEEVRERVAAELPGRSDICVVVVGSVARRDACDYSDLDYFLITEDCCPDGDDVRQKISSLLDAMNIRHPAVGGAFGRSTKYTELTGRIGGFDDVNEALTRRMLFLLESDWIWNEGLYKRAFDALICAYIKDAITEHQLSRFLLNDMIRYYRTICVDFEHKTSGDGGKTWGDRNIKLMFSRKLLYFSGVVAVAETAEHRAAMKRTVLGNLLRKPPIARVREVCGVASGKVVSMYDRFLEHMASASSREMITKTGHDRDKHCDEFRALKNEGHRFSWELEKLLDHTYHRSHPIHHALKL